MTNMPSMSFTPLLNHSLWNRQNIALHFHNNLGASTCQTVESDPLWSWISGVLVIPTYHLPNSLSTAWSHIWWKHSLLTYMCWPNRHWVKSQTLGRHTCTVEATWYPIIIGKVNIIYTHLVDRSVGKSGHGKVVNYHTLSAGLIKNRSLSFDTQKDVSRCTFTLIMSLLDVINAVILRKFWL